MCKTNEKCFALRLEEMKSASLERQYVHFKNAYNKSSRDFDKLYEVSEALAKRAEKRVKELSEELKETRATIQLITEKYNNQGGF